MPEYRVFTKFQEEEEKALVCFRMLPIEPDDPMNSIEADFRDFDEDVALVYYVSTDIITKIEEGKYDSDIEIDPNIPEDIRGILESLVEDLKEKAPESSVRRVSDITGKFKKQRYRISAPKQPNETGNFLIAIGEHKSGEGIPEDERFHYWYTDGKELYQKLDGIIEKLQPFCSQNKFAWYITPTDGNGNLLIPEDYVEELGNYERNKKRQIEENKVEAEKATRELSAILKKSDLNSSNGTDTQNHSA